MTNDQLIQQVEALLNELKAGNDTAINRLSAIIGDVVGGDKTVVGDITGSTVAIGHHIEMTVNEGGLSAEMLDNLQKILDNLRTFMRAGWDIRPGERRKVTVFFSSPGDVNEERSMALEVIERLNKNPWMPFTINHFFWEHTDMAMFANKPPQDNIDDRILPADCDLVVVILWARMGTPMHSGYVKPEPYRFPAPSGDDIDEARFLSGTEYEFVNAMQGVEAKGRPLVLAYRRMERISLDPDEPDFDERTRQKRRVNAFFGNFNRDDGSARWTYIPYDTQEEFARRFEGHLLDSIGALFYTPIPETASHEADIEQPEPWNPDESPFPGLRAFQPEDSLIFFGRERETARLVRRLTREHFVAIVAASGSGKSSLARAGLIPRLLKGALPDAPYWEIVSLKPGEAAGDPYKALAGGLMTGIEQLRPIPGSDGAAARDALAERIQSDTELLSLIEEKLNKDHHLLLLVDQFEELFTVVEESMRADFAETLCVLAQQERIRVVITLRADFYHHCMTLPALRDPLEGGTFPLYPPDPSQLFDMIQRPAGVAGLVFEEGLADQIWEDTSSEPGALALTAYALEQLWKAQYRRKDGLLRRADYEEFGRVAGAIGAQAQKTYDELDLEDDVKEQAFRRVFACLVRVEREEEGGRYIPTRKRAAFKELWTDGSSPAEQLIEALTAWDARLLVTDRDPATSEVVLEVAHEALFKSWDKLKNWIDETGDSLRLIEDTKRQAQRWQESGYDDGFLWTQEQMDPVLAALEEHPELCAELEHPDDLYWRFLRPEYLGLWDELHDDALHHVRRAEIGDRLARINDPRPGVGLVSSHMAEATGEFVAENICGQRWEPEAPVSTGGEIRLWGDDPTHIGLPDIVWLPVEGTKAFEMKDDEGEVVGTFPVPDFYIAKYLVTYQQYKAFLEAEDGFANDDWWQGLSANSDHKSKPGDQNRPTDNHPAENVSWYDAIAFCRWLNARLGYPELPLNATPDTLQDYPGIRLPTEWEWQWVATGGNADHEYPWGPKWDGAKANTTESGLSRTTAVGMYPAGAASCGALDMSGNVYDWCLNERDNPEVVSINSGNSRVLRGGSWDYSFRSARCSYRDRYDPGYRRHYSGFRLCVVRPPQTRG